MEGMFRSSLASAAPSGGRARVATRQLTPDDFQRAESLLNERRYEEAEALLREAHFQRPDDPDLLNKLGCALWELGRPTEAEPFFRRAHQFSPRDALILNHLGLALWDQGRTAEAADCYRQALQLRPDMVDVQMNLGVVLSDLGEFDEALDRLRGAVQQRPYHPDGLQNLGMTLARQGNWGEAIEYYNRALDAKPDYPEVHRNRAYARLFLGDFERGWPEHEWRLSCRRHQGCRVKRPAWRGESLPDKSIVLHYEQGYGDTLQFIRYAALVKQRVGMVFVLCQSRLLRIVSRCAGVDLAFDGSSFMPDCDVHASLMSLPAIFKTTMATVPRRVPYLVNDPIVLDRWRSVLARDLARAAARPGRAPDDSAVGKPIRPFLVGVAWQGSPTHTNDHWRSFTLDRLMPIAKLPGLQLVSLQVNHGLDQLRGLSGELPILELSSQARDFHDTAAIVSQLDLVITPDTSVAHLAGGLGVPEIERLSTVAEWRWMMDREDSPWYPSMRLFRQTKLDDWDGVFRRMADELRLVLEKRAAYLA